MRNGRCFMEVTLVDFVLGVDVGDRAVGTRVESVV